MYLRDSHEKLGANPLSRDSLVPQIGHCWVWATDLCIHS